MAACAQRSPDDATRSAISTSVALQRALAGDESAQTRLFQPMRQILLCEARRHPIARRIRSSFSAEDMVAEVWMRCFASGVLAGFEDRGRGSLRRLLCTILERVLRDMSRRLRAIK